MLSIKVSKKSAERAIEHLKRLKISNKEYRIHSRNSFIYLPILKEKVKELSKLRIKYEISDEKFERKENSSYKSDLLEKFGKDYDKITKAYDIFGDTAIIDADKKFARKLASTIMNSNKNVKTVLRKGGPVEGEYRTRKFHFVAGVKKYIVNYKENNCIFQFDVRNTFFSSRLAFERARITKLVKDGEHVMVMFAGVGPFAIEIAKAHKDAAVVAIEKNIKSYKSMVANVKLNKTPNVIPLLGDVKTSVSDFNAFADRIIMPLPKDGYRFFDAVNYAAKKRCVVHFYAFGKKDTAFKDNLLKIKKMINKRLRIKVLDKRVVRPYSSSDVEIVLDLQIEKT